MIQSWLQRHVSLLLSFMLVSLVSVVVRCWSINSTLVTKFNSKLQYFVTTVHLLTIECIPNISTSLSLSLLASTPFWYPCFMFSFSFLGQNDGNVYIYCIYCDLFLIWRAGVISLSVASISSRHLLASFSMSAESSATPSVEMGGKTLQRSVPASNLFSFAL